MKRGRIILLILLIFTHTPTILQATPAPPVKIRSSDLPDLGILEAATLRRAGLDPRVIQRWQKKSRLAAALPQLQVGFEQKAVQQNTSVIQDSISVTSSGVAIGPESNRVDQDIGGNQGFEFKAVWSLNEILFNHDELDVSREARDLLIFRSQLVEDLHHSYFELKNHLLSLESGGEHSRDPLARTRTEQLVARLNSLSGGEFKRLLESPPGAVTRSPKVPSFRPYPVIGKKDGLAQRYFKERQP